MRISPPKPLASSPMPASLPSAAAVMPKRVRYDPANHYWTVAGSTTQVYSSRVGDYVAIADPAYQQWLADGNSATRIADEQALGRALGRYTDNVTRPTPSGVLDGFKNELADVAEEVFRVLLAPNKLNLENRLRAVERATGLSNAPDLTAQQLKALLKSYA